MSSAQNMMTLDELTALAGDDDGIELGKKKGPYVSPFEPRKAYKVRITEQNITQSKGGWTQAELHLSIVQNDGELKNAGRIWQGLPVFSDEKMTQEDPEKLTKMESIYGGGLHGILRAVNPSVFSIHSRVEKTGKNWKFFDADGEEMSKQAKVAREKAVGKAVKGAAKALVGGQMSLAGVELYYVRTVDAKDSTKSYDQWYATQPDKFELADI